jgi:cytochrome c-type biogenesis protein CcmH
MITFWLIAAAMMLTALGCVVTPLLGRERSYAAMAVGLIALLPSVAMAIYMRLGDPAAVAFESAELSDKGDAPVPIELTISRLAASLRDTPGDIPSWTMLARSYAALDRPADAAAAYQHAIDLDPRNADLLAEYADALASANEGNVTDIPLDIVNAALAVDPDQPKALALAASAALDRRDYAKAIGYWKRLKDVSDGAPEIARQAQKSIDETRALMSKRP